jgi:hypothetical protein
MRVLALVFVRQRAAVQAFSYGLFDDAAGDGRKIVLGALALRFRRCLGLA